MLGSFQDAVQDTLLAAWQGFGGFRGRASLRTWLYRIATNRCLNARRSASHVRRLPARPQRHQPHGLGEYATEVGDVHAYSVGGRAWW
jgi:DNA-directed RNA polymerase specialized sigma24 family protein